MKRNKELEEQLKENPVFDLGSEFSENELIINEELDRIISDNSRIINGFGKKAKSL
jgi:hypothetical protein